MNLHHAARLLSVPTDADDAEVRSAYARAVMADHPDHGGTGTLLGQLKAARDIMMTQGEIPACKLCRGSGKVKLRFGAQTCTACGGSGDRRP